MVDPSCQTKSHAICVYTQAVVDCTVVLLHEETVKKRPEVQPAKPVYKKLAFIWIELNLRFISFDSQPTAV